MYTVEQIAVLLRISSRDRSRLQIVYCCHFLSVLFTEDLSSSTMPTILSGSCSTIVTNLIFYLLPNNGNFILKTVLSCSENISRGKLLFMDQFDLFGPLFIKNETNSYLSCPSSKRVQLLRTHVCQIKLMVPVPLEERAREYYTEFVYRC